MHSKGFMGGPMEILLTGEGEHPGEIPAHRVVNRNGLLTGKHHFRHDTLMQELLESEGIVIEDDCVVDFHRLLWDPYKELI